MGSDGWVHVTRGAISAEPASLLAKKLDPQALGIVESDDHHVNFLKAVRDRRDPVSPVAAGHRATVLGNVADIAVRLGRKLKWDPRTERFVGDDEANTRLAQPMRVLAAGLISRSNDSQASPPRGADIPAQGAALGGAGHGEETSMGKINVGLNAEFSRSSDKPFEWAVAQAAEMGYKYFEPMIHFGRELMSEAGYFHTVSMFDDPWRIRDACDKAGLTISGLQAARSPGPARRARRVHQAGHPRRRRDRRSRHQYRRGNQGRGGPPRTRTSC